MAAPAVPVMPVPVVVDAVITVVVTVMSRHFYIFRYVLR
jgi:hypothetical protein